MNVLVTAASKYGATADMARTIGETLTDRGLEASVVEPEKAGSVEDFDAVILGSAVYAGRWLKPAREFAEREGDALARRPVWLFSSGPIGDPPKPEEDPVDVASIMETTKAREHRVFSGRIEKKQLSFPDRAIVTAMRVPDGDFRDFDEVREWAAGIADALQPD